MKKIKTSFKTLKYFIKRFYETSPWLLIFVILEALINSLLNVSIVYLPKIVIEKINSEDLLISVVIFLGIYSLLKILVTVFENVNFYYARKLVLKCDDILNKKLANVLYMNFEDKEYLDRLYFAKKSLHEYTGGPFSVVNHFKTILQHLLTLIGFISVFFIYSQYYVLLSIALGVVFCSFIYRTMNKELMKFNVKQAGINKLKNYFNMSLYSKESQLMMRTTNSMGMLDKYAEDINNKDFKNIDNFSRKFSLLSSLETLLANLFIRIVPILVYVFYFKNNTLTIAVIVLLYSASISFGTSLKDIVFLIQNYTNDSIYLDKFISIVEEKTIKGGKLHISEIETIKFENVSFKYKGSEDYILENISLEIKCPQKLAIVGINGSGKSTLIKLACGLLKPTKGRILVNGVDINEYDSQGYYDKMNAIFQDYSIFSFTVKDNICLNNFESDRLTKALIDVGAYDRIVKLPNKENTFINKWFDDQGVVFSSGELQKIALARSIYKESNFVILDEPTAALDIQTEYDIYNNMDKMLADKMIFFVSHRLSGCVFCDNIIVINNKKIEQQGNHFDLMKNESGIYYKLFHSQTDFFLS